MYFDYDGLLNIVKQFKETNQKDGKFKGYYMFMVDSHNQFEQVRFIPQHLDGWDQSDTLQGNEKYGKQGDDSKAWAIPFDATRAYIKFKVQSVDKEITKYYDTKDDVIGNMRQLDLLNDINQIKEHGGANVYISYGKFHEVLPRLNYKVSHILPIITFPINSQFKIQKAKTALNDT